MKINIDNIENMTPLNQTHTPPKNHIHLGSIISPIKRGLSPQREINGNVEIRKFERSINDLTIANSELIRERDSLESELKVKSTQLKNKNIKINELIHENTHLVKELQRERDNNEEDFTNWTDRKFELEAKIRSLNDILLKRIQNDELESTKEINHSESVEQIQHLELENEKLTKKINMLKRENELEVQSKMLIIDEIETLKSNFNDLSEDYEQVKLDYDELVTEYSLNQVIENDFEDDIITTPTLETSDVFKLDNPKIRHISSSSSVTISPNEKRSLSRAIRDTEIQSQKAKYSQIIMNYEFTIQSLTLQTEKLISYIGFIEQKMDGHDGVEYSDDVNIRNAKKTIKSIMRSVSTIGLTTKPGEIDRDLKFLDLDIGSAIQLTNDDESFCESLAYSTDYNKGNVTNLEVGSDFSFNDIEDGDDELEEGDEEEYQNINENNDSVIISNKSMNRYSSTDSLNVSFKMDFQPTLKSRKSKMLKEPSRTHVKRITKLPSEMDIRGHDFNGDEYYNTEQRLSNKSSMKILTNSQLIHSINEGAGTTNIESFKIMGDDEIGSNGYAAFPHISEGDEEFDDISQLSSDGDEEDEEVGVSISNKELDDFKMVWRSGFCAKHSLLLCLCHQKGLVNNLMLQFAMNPIYKLRRGNRRNNTLGTPLRYQKRLGNDSPIPLIDMQIVD